MMPSARGGETNCPCLIPTVGRRGRSFAVSVYCRLPNGRVRVPTPDQLASLCTVGEHHDCPGYHRWVASHGWIGA